VLLSIYQFLFGTASLQTFDTVAVYVPLDPILKTFLFCLILYLLRVYTPTPTNNFFTNNKSCVIKFCMLLVCYVMLLQLQTELLKNVTSDGTPTKLVAVGIGNLIDEDELKLIASEPDDKNVILADDYDSLNSVAEQVVVATCEGC